MRGNLGESPGDFASVGVEEFHIEPEPGALEKLCAREIDRGVRAAELDAVDAWRLQRVACLRGERCVNRDRVGLAEIELALEVDVVGAGEAFQPGYLWLDADRLLADGVDADALVGADRDRWFGESGVVAAGAGDL